MVTKNPKNKKKCKGMISYISQKTFELGKYCSNKQTFMY